MKKIILILSFTAIVSCLFAEDPKYGLVVGANYANSEKVSYGDEAVGGEKYKNTFLLPSLGVYYQRNVFKWLGVKTSLLYNPKGGDKGISSYDPQGQTIDYNAPHVIERLNYLSVPLELELFPQRKFNLKGGIELSYLLGNPESKELPNSTMYRFEYGYRFGFQFSIGIVDVDIMYAHSLTNWLDSRLRDNDGNRYYNRYLTATLSVPLNGLITRK